MQNDGDPHDTDVSPMVPSIATGLGHERPLNVSARPFLSTAMQNEGDPHDMTSPPPPTAVGAPNADPV
jgi:hypothetical protein